MNTVEYFSIDNGNFSSEEIELLNLFFNFISRNYKIKITAKEVKYKRVEIGLSPVLKLFTKTNSLYPFFLKIGHDNEIQKESRNYGKARHKMPPLSMPPLETFISYNKLKDKELIKSKTSLIAFRSITGRDKLESPRSLFDEYNNINQYKIIEIIDEIFQVTLRDLHGFGDNPVFKEIEYAIHDLELFSRKKFQITTDMVIKYNNLAEIASLSPKIMPHGFVHGDLHCNNILLGRSNMPVIIDFAMLREEGCLLCDYAELEVAILVTALASNFQETANSARNCYKGMELYDHYGVDKFSRCVRVLRSNLLHSVFSVCSKKNDIEHSDVSFVYQMLLLRYLCSYSWVSHETIVLVKQNLTLSIETFQILPAINLH